ncbi:Protein C05B5.4 [Aphelenchoides avenae]|nr:Protein C05B5.4 [Aphelenchus avenae]
MLQCALFLSCACTVACYSSSSHQRKPFWISVDVHRLEYRPECFSLCKDPKLELAFTNTATAQPTSKAWTMRKAATGDEGDFQLMTYWTGSEPANVTLRGAVVGTDVQLKFQRMCDVDPDRSSFQFFVETVILQHLNQGTYEFTANCLNVTLQVQLFTERCPWCPVEVKQEARHEAQVSAMDFSKLQLYGFIVLTVVCTALLVAVTALLCAHSKKKHRATKAGVSSVELPDIVRSDGVHPRSGLQDPQRLLRLPLTPMTPPKYYIPPRMPPISFWPAPSYLPTTCAPEEL